MDQSQEILLGHAIFASSEYGYHGYRRIARSISNKYSEVIEAPYHREVAGGSNRK